MKQSPSLLSDVKIWAIIELVVVLPWVPATAIVSSGFVISPSIWDLFNKGT